VATIVFGVPRPRGSLPPSHSRSSFFSSFFSFFPLLSFDSFPLAAPPEWIAALPESASRVSAFSRALDRQLENPLAASRGRIQTGDVDFVFDFEIEIGSDFQRHVGAFHPLIIRRGRRMQRATKYSFVRLVLIDKLII